MAILLGCFGAVRAIEGWRLEPLDAHIHANWWQLPAARLPEQLSNWRPGGADGRRWSGYSQVLLHATGRNPPSSAAMQRAIAATERALSLAPAQPAAWARLALLRLNMGQRQGAAAALAASWRTGPAEGSLSGLRGRLGLFLWNELPVRGQEYTAKDLRRWWNRPPSADLPYPRQALVRFAHGIGRLDAVRDALPKREHALLAKRVKSVLMEAAGAS